jgi:hypothetical protein
MSTSFLDALQQQSAKLQNGKNKHEKKDIPRLNAGMYVQPLIVDIFFVSQESGNIIELKFNRKPEQKIRDTLKSFFWQYDANKQVWKNSDNDFTRKFVKSEFQAKIELLEKPAESSESPHFALYKKQVNTLSEYFDLDPAELVIKAIDCLYVQTKPFLAD